MEDFVATENHVSGFDQSEAGADVPGDELEAVRGRKLAGLQHFREPVNLRVALAGDQHARRFARGDGIEFVADAMHAAAEPLDRFDVQVNRRFHARPRECGNDHARQLHEARERLLRRKQPVREGHAFVEVVRLLFEFTRFGEDNPRLRREVVGE